MLAVEQEVGPSLQQASARRTSRSARGSTSRAAASTGQRPGGRQLEVHELLQALSVNAARHCGGLRSFREGEFGSGPQAPTGGHVAAVNKLLGPLRQRLGVTSGQLRDAAAAVTVHRRRQGVDSSLAARERSDRLINSAEAIWQFYFDLFHQRRAFYSPMLLSADRIAVDCYEAVYTNLGADASPSVPAPGPMTRVQNGMGPATLRRGIRSPYARGLPNPFPLVSLPYHRLVTPWTLGAIHHEVGHNIQSDLDMWEIVPKRLHRRLSGEGLPIGVVQAWVRWHKEVWADLIGVLLGGPANVRSLTEVVAKSSTSVTRYNPRGVHPVSYLRILLSERLVERLGFQPSIRPAWNEVYGRNARRDLPPALLSTAPKAIDLVINEIVDVPYQQLGGRSLGEVVAFTPDHELLSREAGVRLAAGTDPGIVPARFLVAAARWAMDLGAARPGAVSDAFYKALEGR